MSGGRRGIEGEGAFEDGFVGGIDLVLAERRRYQALERSPDAEQIQRRDAVEEPTAEMRGISSSRMYLEPDLAKPPGH